MGANDVFIELIRLINSHSLEEMFVEEEDLYAILYKYWEGECGEQETYEDLSYLMDRRYVFEVIALIKICDPSQLEGDLEIGYSLYFERINS